MTDAGLKELASLKNLTYLTLRGTKVTKAGAEELLQVLPKCHIEMFDERGMLVYPLKP